MKIEPIRLGSGSAIVLAALTSFISWLSASMLTAFLALVATGTTFALCRKVAGNRPPAGPLAAALGAGTFPFWVAAQGEPGLMWAGTMALLIVAGTLLSFRPANGVARTGGALIWLPFYVGFGLSYAVLIRQQEAGKQLLFCVALILAAYKGSTLVASKIAVPKSANVPGGGLLLMRLAGIAAAEVAAMAALTFLEEPFSPGPLAILGLLVAFAAMLGEAAGRMIVAGTAEAEVHFTPLAALDAWFIALPAFFYGFRLFLT